MWTARGPAELAPWRWRRAFIPVTSWRPASPICSSAISPTSVECSRRSGHTHDAGSALAPRAGRDRVDGRRHVSGARAPADRASRPRGGVRGGRAPRATGRVDGAGARRADGLLQRHPAGATRSGHAVGRRHAAGRQVWPRARAGRAGRTPGLRRGDATRSHRVAAGPGHRVSGAGDLSELISPDVVRRGSRLPVGQLLDGFTQLLHVERLGYERVEARPDRTFLVSLTVRADGDGGRLRAAAVTRLRFQLIDEPVSILDRHGEIDEKDIRRDLSEPGQAIPRGCRDHDEGAVSLQHHLHDRARVVVVVDDDDMDARQLLTSLHRRHATPVLLRAAYKAVKTERIYLCDRGDPQAARHLVALSDECRRQRNAVPASRLLGLRLGLPGDPDARLTVGRG